MDSIGPTTIIRPQLLSLDGLNWIIWIVFMRRCFAEKLTHASLKLVPKTPLTIAWHTPNCMLISLYFDLIRHLSQLNFSRFHLIHFCVIEQSFEILCTADTCVDIMEKIPLYIKKFFFTLDLGT